METKNEMQNDPKNIESEKSQTTVEFKMTNLENAPQSPSSSQEIQALSVSENKAESKELKKQEKKQESSAIYKAPKKKSKLLKATKVLLVLGVIGFGGYHFLGDKLAQVNQQYLSSAYLTTQVTQRELRVSVSSTGTVTPIDSFNVSSLTTGDILSAPFEEGDMVTKGQVLFEFDSSTAVNSIQQAQLSYERAVLAYEQTVDGLLCRANAVGVVQEVLVKEGETVSAGTVIAYVSDTTETKVTIPFHSSQIQDFAVGMVATVIVQQNNEQLSGVITDIDLNEEVGLGNTLLHQVEITLDSKRSFATDAEFTAMVNSGGESVYSAGYGTFLQSAVYNLTATGSGDVAELYLQKGDWVKHGDAVLLLGGKTSEYSLSNAQNSIDSAQLSLESSQDALDNYTVTAPISGTVIEKKFKAGDKVDSTSLSAAGGNLAVIYDMSYLTFEMNIHELDINKIEVGQLVEVTADAVEGAMFTGVVDKISVSGVTAGGMTSYPITVVLDQTEGLKPGMNVSAEVIMESVGEVLALPIEAVSRGATGGTVTIALEGALNEEGKVMDLDLTEVVEVELGINDSSYIQIVSGISSEDTVIWENDVVDMFANLPMGPRG